MTSVQPWVLPANQPPERFYAGGERIAAFRGEAAARPHTPEDWVGSVTTLFGETDLGLSRLPTGELLVDAIVREPLAWLGAEHVAAHGAEPALLVKLLDAGQRLPVHVHPDVPFAQRYLGLSHGKTEAWVFLEPAPVWLGWRRDVARAELLHWMAQQDVDAMLAAMHRVEAEAGEAILVPAGTPHAIGEGAFIVEVQEPTDLSVLLEWRDFAIDGPAAGHLGLGFDLALGAVVLEASIPLAIEALRQSSARDEGDLLPDAERFFRVQRSRGDASWDAGFSVAVVTAGAGEMTSASGHRLALQRGVTVVTPHAAGAWRLSDHGGLEVLRCRPPAAQ